MTAQLCCCDIGKILQWLEQQEWNYSKMYFPSDFKYFLKWFVRCPHGLYCVLVGSAMKPYLRTAPIYDVPGKFISSLKSLLLRTSFSVAQSVWNFPQSMAVILLNDWATEIDVMDEQVFARFGFKMSLGGLSYIAIVPWCSLVEGFPELGDISLSLGYNTNCLEKGR